MAKDKEIDTKDKVDADELTSIMGGKMSEKEKEKKELFEGKDDDSEKEDTDADKDKDKSEEDEEEADKEADKDEDEDEDEHKEDEEEKEEAKDDKKKDDDEGDDKDSDKDEDEDVDEKQSLEDEIAALRKTIKEMTTPPLKEKKEEGDDEEKDEDEKKEETKLEKKGKDYVFITQKELDGEEFAVDAKFLNDFGNKIANQVKKDSLTSTANIVKSHISETQKLRDLATSFYKKNPDLDEDDLKTFVAWRVGALANDHPDWSYEKLFSNLGKDVRGKLGIKAQAEKIEKKRKDKPAFVKKPKGKSKTEKKEVTGIKKEIAELLPK